MWPLAAGPATFGVFSWIFYWNQSRRPKRCTTISVFNRLEFMEIHLWYRMRFTKEQALKRPTVKFVWTYSLCENTIEKPGYKVQYQSLHRHSSMLAWPPQIKQSTECMDIWEESVLLAITGIRAKWSKPIYQLAYSVACTPTPTRLPYFPLTTSIRTTVGSLIFPLYTSPVLSGQWQETHLISISSLLLDTVIDVA